MIVHNKKSGCFKVAIIDHVGKKAGMDYYDLSLLNSLSKSSAETYLFSNFYKKIGNINIYKTFSIVNINIIFKALNFVKGYVSSFFYCKLRNVNVLILHLFSSSFESLARMMLAKLLQFNVIVINHDVSSFSNYDSGFFRKIILNILADKVVVHNRFSLNHMLKMAGNGTRKKIHTIKHGNYLLFTGNNVSKDYALERLKLDINFQYILFFGQIKKPKRLDLLIEAMPFIKKNVKLIIAGRPWKDNFSYYQRIIEKLCIQERVIKYIRYIEDRERDLFFNVCDALIIPYKVIYQSGVLLMGMSYGLPVIASDLEPNLEVIKDKKNGMLFKSGDKRSLAKKVNKLIQDEKMNKRIGMNALKTVKNEYSWDKIAEKYLKIIK